MTRIATSKQIVRETDETVRGKPLTVALFPRYMEIRRKGTQEEYRISYSAAFDRAAQRQAEQIAATERMVKYASRRKKESR